MRTPKRDGGEETTVTVDKLAHAIERRLGFEPARASAIARRVLDYFGFEAVIIDNAVAPEDRKLFYELHDAGLLRSSLDSVILANGKTWRIFYWEIDERQLDRIAGRTERKGGAALYSDLPPEAWTSHAAPV